MQQYELAVTWRRVCHPEFLEVAAVWNDVILTGQIDGMMSGDIVANATSREYDGLRASNGEVFEQRCGAAHDPRPILAPGEPCPRVAKIGDPRTPEPGGKDTCDELSGPGRRG